MQEIGKERSGSSVCSDLPCNAPSNVDDLSQEGQLSGQAFGRPQRVIYQCSEDGVSVLIKPRLEKGGADCGI